MRFYEPTIDSFAEKTMATRLVGKFLGRLCEVVGSRPMAAETMFIASGEHRILFVNFLDGLSGKPTSMQTIDTSFFKIFEVNDLEIQAEFYEDVDPKIETVKIKRS